MIIEHPINLELLLQQKGITKPQLAELLGVTKKTAYNICADPGSMSVNKLHHLLTTIGYEPVISVELKEAECKNVTQCKNITPEKECKEITPPMLIPVLEIPGLLPTNEEPPLKLDLAPTKYSVLDLLKEVPDNLGDVYNDIRPDQEW